MPNKPLKGVWFETEIVLESMGEIQEALEIFVEDFKRKQEVFFQEFATKPKFKGIEEENIRKRYATAPVPIIMYGFRRYCWNHVRFLVESEEIPPEKDLLYCKIQESFLTDLDGISNEIYFVRKGILQKAGFPTEVVQQIEKIGMEALNE